MDKVSGVGERNVREAPTVRSSGDRLPAIDAMAMLDAMPNGVLLISRPEPTRPHPVILWTNRALRELTGLGGRELVGARLRVLRDADAADPGFTALLGALQAGERWDGELSLVAPRDRVQRHRAQAVLLDGDKLALLEVEAREVGRSGAESIDPPGLTRLLGDLVDGGFYRLGADIDAGLHLDWIDPTVERLTGYPFPELLARGGITGIVVPRDRAKLRRRNLELMAGVSSDISYRIQTAQGTELRLFDRARPLRTGALQGQAGAPIERAIGMLRPALPERQDLLAPGLPLADYRLLADLLGAAVLAIDADLRLLWIATGRDEPLCRALQALGQGLLDEVLGLEIAEDWRDRIEQALEGERRVEASFQWPVAGQDWQMVLQPMSTETVLAVVRPAREMGATTVDRTAHPETESDRFLKLVLDHVTDGVLVVDADGVVGRASRSAERIFDLPGGGLVGRPAAHLFQPPLPSLRRRASDEDEEPPRPYGECRAVRRSGEQVPVEVAMASHGDTRDGVLIVRDITLRKQTEETIRNLAYTDPLTGLPNRLLFLDRLSQAIERARRARQQLAVMVVDLDRFKLINESLGLDKGDRVLRAAATRIGNALRKSDTVARPGSDEFLILALATEGAEGAAKVAQKTLDCLQAPFQVNGDEPTVAASIGISLFPFDGDHPDQLLKNAGTALARAKEQGSNSYQFYTTDMNAKAYQRLVLESRLRKAVEKGELLLHFQPLVGLAEDKIVGVEALLRWNSPELGMIPPGDFVPIAEETGLILPIGDWVLRQAVLQMREWHTEGLDGLRIAVNISARQFQAHDFVAKVRRLLMDSGFPGPCLELELTESSIMQDVQDTVHRLHELTELGVRVTVDDFGTGYSSLAYLKRFPIGALKIDRSFIADVTTDANDAAIARAVVALADTLRVRVVGEGVETPEQLAFLRELGCHEAQGFLIGRPMPAADAFERLREDGSIGG